MENIDLFVRFDVAIAIGFLIGLQRENAYGGPDQMIIAGERTFAMFSLTGALAAMLADQLGSALAFLGIILFLGLFTTVAYFNDSSSGKVGLTTEVAIVVAISVGALCYWGHLTLAIAVGIATTVLLSIKWETDRLRKIFCFDREGGKG